MMSVFQRRLKLCFFLLPHLLDTRFEQSESLPFSVHKLLLERIQFSSPL